MLIFAGIVARFPQMVAQLLYNASTESIARLISIYYLYPGCIVYLEKGIEKFPCSMPGVLSVNGSMVDKVRTFPLRLTQRG